MSESTLGKLEKGELELINRLAPKPLDSNEVFAFTVTLCDNDIDRDFERFSDETLMELSRLFVGKTGILDHAHKAENQLSRIFSCRVEKTGEKTSDGRDYCRLIARAYMLRNERTEVLISEIEGGIKKEVSVGCAVSGHLCSICGTDRRIGCNHKSGKKYGGAVCHTVLSGANDAYEWSFVAVPAQRKAGITKSFTKRNKDMEKDILKNLSSGEEVILSPEDAAALHREITSLKTMSAIGEQYLTDRRNGVVKGLLGALPTLSESVIVSVCEKLSLLELDEIYRGLSAAPSAPQLAKSASRRENNGEFIIK